ncbi:mitochondrial ubiquitin ligase activator of nfkb 1-A [Ictalurus punctatus]|uniref:RING-type E3 ubiquitin transferase n=1 Tax=Ictalurus punctatus TaxID=7998 RepID=W5UAS2_ICTPU|nr:mitochondrial ubiquitin ligase activator of nfkb 1-A [Ictalurus punctatus]XP_017351834.1 mitochondrial ubiquitin ligase activator of nfkb 1-A [Ictalurus punctatus]XP_017351835.1 mitochondrial ubiquitin ligase activator of nfkb 1-A [Ictalurus punctatus]XP_017351836.1 mitochondrial ubiquitin ligase activator of nfkb 1-A [Ictalurus punctatus]XP_053529665.1 mitochondrial ubiquitin ligase activator of nfkb 1-A [Ictalurus punctatus]
MEEFSIGTMDTVLLGSSIAFSGLFYYLYRKKCKTVDKLNDAPRMVLNEELVGLLNATPGKCLQYVVIEGTVQPIEEPLSSQFKEGTFGVIQKLLLQEHKLVWNSLARTWMDRERVLHERVSSVPFALVGGDGAQVRVLRPLEASGLEMETVHEKFHQANYGFGDLLSQYLSGEKSKGQLETEEMLRVGVSITAAGELILDSDRLLKLRPPTDGSTYFLTTTDFESLRLGQEGQASCWWALAGIFALVGVAVVLWAGLRSYRQIQRKWQRERMRREFERIGEGEEDLENACVICLSNPRGCVLLDCGHVCCCYSCYEALPQPTCPVCRQGIRRVVPLYQA